MIDHVTLMSPVRIEGRVTTILHPSSAGQYPLVSTSSPAEGFAERCENARRHQRLVCRRILCGWVVGHSENAAAERCQNF